MTDATTAGLISWLLEQIAEDERVAAELPADGYPLHDLRVLSVKGTLDVPWPDRWNPVLVLAECDAKRRIIAACQPFAVHDYSTDGEAVAWGVLTTLALPYTNREGYREEWKQ